MIDFLHAGTYLLKLQVDHVILGGRGQACLGIPKGAIKTLRSQKIKEVLSSFCACSFISIKATN